MFMSINRVIRPLNVSVTYATPFGEDAATCQLQQPASSEVLEMSLEDEECEGGPSEVDEEALKECIEKDLLQSARELATKFG